jgi:neopullulanase
MKRIIFLLLIFLPAKKIFASDMVGVYPTHWFTGMKNSNLQLMMHGENIAGYTKVTITYPGVRVLKVNKVENKNYIFVDLSISATAKPGNFKIHLKGGGMPAEDVNYSLKGKNRENGKTRVMGVNAKDFIYLIMPDRFANGDPSNDIIPEYRDQGADRNNKFSRHGGDLQGIQNRIDYFKQLGVTTLWLTPIIENDMPRVNEWGNEVAGYHGYWFTNHYEVDKRFGGNEAYREFCDKLHANGMKVIQDAVYNHVGNQHFSVMDPPMKDWLNNWPAFQGPNHREEVFFDPYASAYDRKVMLDGWFVPHLPDLNQRNPYVAKFLIQHAVWTTEEYGIDGWRVDTYKYCDEQFMNDINTALEKEFPALTIFGESWVNGTVANAYFARNNMNTLFKHNAKGMLDFQTCFAMLEAMNTTPGWLSGVGKMYTTLSQDVLYKDPMNNVNFLDNHDMDRVFSVVGEDMKKFKMGLNWLMTLRGIPQIYYGTEVLMKNKKENTDATVREDFPGGWVDDKEKDNRFLEKGRSDKQQEVFNHVSRLAHFRKNSSALTAGKTMQFIPDNGLYVYYRYDAKQTIMVIANTGDKDVKPDWSRFTERMKGFSRVRDVVSGKTESLQGLEIDSKDSYVFELLK